MLYKILCPCLRSVQMDDIDVDVGDCIHSVEMESNSLARNDSLQQEQQKMPEEEVNDDITNNNNNNIAFIELNPLAKEITPSEYESKWKSYPLSTTRYYELIAEEGIEIDFEQMLGVHYIYTLASGQQQSNLIKSYLYAEEKTDGNSDAHLYLLELVLRGDGTIVLRVKSEADSNPEQFIALVEHVLKRVARPRGNNNNNNNNNRRRYGSE